MGVDISTGMFKPFDAKEVHNEPEAIDVIVADLIPTINKRLKELGYEKNLAKVKGFFYYALTPAFELFIQKKLVKERGKKYELDPIDPNEKDIFPEGSKTVAEYFEEFIKLYKEGKIKVPFVAGNHRDFDKYMNIFLSFPDDLKQLFFEEIYYAMWGYGYTRRELSCTVKVDLDSLKNEVKNNGNFPKNP